jgi:hypothetical protein
VETDSTTETDSPQHVEDYVFHFPPLPHTEPEVITTVEPKTIIDSEKVEYSVWHPVSKLLSPLEFLLFGINMIFLLDYWCEQDQITRAARLIQTAETYYAVDIMTNLQ